ncbi:MAG: hypothetical protein ACF8Q5_08780 [Phycisphaerales bacterium JB040]
MSNATAQLRRVAPTVCLVAAAWACVAGVAALLAHRSGIELASLSRDPAAVMQAPYYTGILSLAGSMLWGVIVGVCLIGARLHRVSDPGLSGFLRAGALLALVLGADDTFQLHDRILPLYLGTPESVIIGAYLGATGLFLWRFRRNILETDWTILLLGGAGFALSIGLDKLLEYGSVATFIEDVAKLLGIMMWSAYFTRAASTHALALATSPGHTASPAPPATPVGVEPDSNRAA